MEYLAAAFCDQVQVICSAKIDKSDTQDERLVNANLTPETAFTAASAVQSLLESPDKGVSLQTLPFHILSGMLPEAQLCEIA